MPPLALIWSIASWQPISSFLPTAAYVPVSGLSRTILTVSAARAGMMKEGASCSRLAPAAAWITLRRCHGFVGAELLILDLVTGVVSRRRCKDVSFDFGAKAAAENGSSGRTLMLGRHKRVVQGGDPSWTPRQAPLAGRPGLWITSAGDTSSSCGSCTRRAPRLVGGGRQPQALARPSGIGLARGR